MGPDTDTRRRLLAERDRLGRQVDALVAQFDGIVAASEDVATDDEHDPEGHTIAFERQQVAALVRDARIALTDVNAALAAFDAGTYGTCEVCGGPIGVARLAALPAARRCVTCAA
jgi:RNA polymerase-binding transcription factor DksA